MTCLCELLISVPTIEIGTTLASIDENTKVSDITTLIADR